MEPSFRVPSGGLFGPGGPATASLVINARVASRLGRAWLRPHPPGLDGAQSFPGEVRRPFRCGCGLPVFISHARVRFPARKPRGLVGGSAWSREARRGSRRVRLSLRAGDLCRAILSCSSVSSSATRLSGVQQLRQVSRRGPAAVLFYGRAAPCGGSRKFDPVRCRAEAQQTRSRSPAA